MAWRSSRFSRSSALSLAAISLLKPGLPLSRSAFFTHSFNVCAVQPILDAIDTTVAQRDRGQPRDPAPTGSLVRVLRSKTCSLSCLSSLHSLKGWSLRHTRGGSGRARQLCPLHDARHAHSEQRRDLTARLTVSDRRNHPLPQIHRIGSGPQIQKDSRQLALRNCTMPTDISLTWI